MSPFWSLPGRTPSADPTALAGDAAPPPWGSIGTDLTRVASMAGPVWIPSADEVMLPFIKKFGCWEPEEGDYLLQLARPGTVFLDVGASFGYFSRLIASKVPSTRIHSFEPHPMMARILALNTWEFGDRVTVWPTALGGERGTVGLSVAEHNLGDIRARISEGSFHAVAPLTPLDDLVTGRIDVVKIDSQGFESDILTGMTAACRANPQMTIVAEFWPSAITDRHLRPSDVLSLYRSLGFRTHLLRDGAATAADDDEILGYATGAGRDGQATVVLRKSQ